MRLSDLILENKIKYVNKVIPIGRTTRHANLDQIGFGVDANVFQSNIRSDEVIKRAILPSLHDPTIKFIELVMNNQSNPHFPRIKAAKVYPTSSGDYVLFVRMEKLLPFNNPKISHMLPTFMKQLGISTDVILKILKARSDTGEVDLNNISEEQRKYLTYMLLNIIDSVDDIKKLSKLTKNEQLSKALNELYKFIHKNNATLDLHGENIMVRLGNPPQLVITDPVRGD